MPLPRLTQLERKVVAEDQLQRIDIRAAIGGVIGSGGDAIMLIAPEGQSLIVEARAAPQDTEQPIIGQSAQLCFLAGNQRTTPGASAL